MRTLGLGMALVVVSMSGCGAAGSALSAPVRAEPAGASAPELAPMAAPPAAAPPSPRAAGSWGGASMSMEPAPAPATAARPPSERPGLGTEWGETRSSSIHDVDFTRSNETHPFAIATLHYDDRRGVEALASYHSWSGPRLRAEPVVGGAIAVSVRDEANQPLEAIHLADRTFIVGEQGARYTIVVENHSGHRVEAVATVDGLDVMNGRDGSLHDRGYVVDPYETLTIDGFRQNQATVAAFRFAKVGDSYAARTGSARNVGVIGVAFFDERGDAYARWSPDELRRRDTADPFPEVDRRYAPPPPVVRW